MDDSALDHRTRAPLSRDAHREPARSVLTGRNSPHQALHAARRVRHPNDVGSQSALLLCGFSVRFRGGSPQSLTIPRRRRDELARATLSDTLTREDLVVFAAAAACSLGKTCPVCVQRQADPRGPTSPTSSERRRPEPTAALPRCPRRSGGEIRALKSAPASTVSALPRRGQTDRSAFVSVAERRRAPATLAGWRNRCTPRRCSTAHHRYPRFDRSAQFAQRTESPRWRSRAASQ